jgi:hypothetical protein
LEEDPLAAVAAANFRPASVRERGQVVRFYTNDGYLLDSLCSWFIDALNAGESIVAVMADNTEGV